MPRFRPPWRDAITYFRWDAKDWIRQNRAGWSLDDMNNTVDTLWLLHPAIQNHYTASRAANAAVRPGLPAPNHIPAQPYTQADLAHVQNHGQLPPLAVPAPAPAPVVPVPVPVIAAPAPVVPAPVPIVPVIPAGPAPAPPMGGAVHVPVTQGVDAGTQAVQVNTTDLLYQPNVHTVQYDLPSILDIEYTHEGAKTNESQVRVFEEHGLGNPEKDESALEWSCAHFLGQGSTGTVTLWVGVDESKTIVERLAVRDVVVAPQTWIGPIFWRDKLPMELAVQTRLERRKAHEHHVHRYYGHRIDMRKRRFRVFNEVCEMGDLVHALDWYSRGWRRRRNMFRWQNTHKTVRSTLDYYHKALAADNANPELHEQHEKHMKEHLTRAWKAFEEKKHEKLYRHGSGWNAINRNPELPSDTLLDEYEHMSEIEDWHNDLLPDELPDVIPEWFLWRVFDQLVDAFTMLGSGRIDEDDDDVDWNEIVHRDGHLMNIFVKPAEGAVGKEVEPEDKHHHRQFGAHEAPSIVLADFDHAFFDLQSGDDIYADNPTHYIMRDHPKDADTGGRYAPEMFWSYEGHRQQGQPYEKMTGRTDVWQVGQVMWNLVMNLPGKLGYVQEPFTYTTGPDGEGIERMLHDGSKYGNDRYRDDLFSERQPYEASGMYSKALRNAVLKCMDYRQHQRWSFAQLKSVTSKWAGREPPPDSRAHGDLIIKVSDTIEEFGLGKTYERSSKKRRT